MVELERIEVPVTIWHGSDDRNLPLPLVRRQLDRIFQYRANTLSQRVSSTRSR